MPFELTILGSSSALPTSERYPTAQVLNVLERYFLIDCGEGTQIQLRRLKFRFGRISRIFISHLHGDHFYGLIGLISSFNLLGLTQDLHVYAHSELPKLLNPLLENLKGDIQFNIVFHPLNFKKPQLIYADKAVEVTSFPLKHSIPVCGFLFREKQKPRNLIREKLEEYRIPVSLRNLIKNGEDFITEDGTIIPNQELTTPPMTPRSYAFCTDTAYHEPAVELIRDVDLLYHESTFLSEDKETASQTLHSTAAEAATIAAKANVKKLLLGHFSTRYKNVELFVNEARKIFPETYAAHDGEIYSVSR